MSCLKKVVTNENIIMNKNQMWGKVLPDEVDNYFIRFTQRRSFFICIIEKSIRRFVNKKFVMKMKQMGRLILRAVNMERQKERNFIFLETTVLFRAKTVENSKKYMQTVQPFLLDVGYNILGEGQLFIDETAGYAYNIKGLPLLAINWLLNRVNSENSIQEGEAICHH